MDALTVMRQALEALHFARLSIDEWSGYASDYFQNKYDLKGDIAEVEQAITALRVAIASYSTAIHEWEQAEKQSAEHGEPVATVVSENKPVTMSWWHEPALPVGTKLYTTPPNVATQLAAQRPVAEPHKWVGLTPDEVFSIADQHPVEGFDPDIMAYTRAIEAKLRAVNGFSCDATEKNGGQA